MSTTTIQQDSSTVSPSEHVLRIDLALRQFEGIIHRFGFLPHESIVVSWNCAGNEVLVQRSDLPVSDGFDTWLEGFVGPLEQYEPDSLHLYIYSNRAIDYLTTLREDIASNLSDRGIAILTTLLICDTKAYLADCDPTCDEHLWAWDLDKNLSLSRAHLAERFAYDPSVGISRKVRRQANLDFDPENPQMRSKEIEFIAAFLAADELVSESVIARIAYACQDIRVRDVILWLLANNQLKDIQTAEKLSEFLPHLRGPWTAPIASMAAIAWWVSGNGAKANMCVDRALTENSSYTLAMLVRAALVHGVAASLWISTVTELSKEECFVGQQNSQEDGVPLAR